jgi:hypothetical protein
VAQGPGGGMWGHGFGPSRGGALRVGVVLVRGCPNGGEVVVGTTGGGWVVVGTTGGG